MILVDIKKIDMKFYGKIKLFFFSFLIIFLFSFVPHAYSSAQNNTFKNKLNSNNAPIRIKSNKMIVLEKQNKVIFTGDVVATQGNMTIEADSLTVVYKKEKDKKKRDNITNNRIIKEVLANGHIKITNKSITAFSDKAILLKEKDILILKGNAKIIKNNNKITGDTITIYLNQNKSIVTADTGHKVEAIIYPNNIK